jgi:hypothetical protein
VTPFELTVTVPADRRFGDTVGAVAAAAARQAGIDEPAAVAFGADVERALHGCLEGQPAAGDGQITVLVRRDSAALEVMLTCATGVKVARTLRIDV